MVQIYMKQMNMYMAHNEHTLDVPPLQKKNGSEQLPKHNVGCARCARIYK